jgi:hypothetical protein
MDRARTEVDAAKTEARDAANKVADDVKSAASDVKNDAVNMAEERKEEFSGSLGRVAQELERSAQNCSEQDRWASELLGQGAAALKSIARNLDNRSVDGVVSSTQSYAREHPAPFLGASIAAGFLLSRMGKTAAARASEHGDNLDRQRNYNGASERTGDTATPTAFSSDYTAARPTNVDK